LAAIRNAMMSGQKASKVWEFFSKCEWNRSS